MTGPEEAEGEEAQKLAAVLAYHHQSSHFPNRMAPGPGRMDWANQPQPFRRYVGSILYRLPLVEGAEAARYEDLYLPPAKRSPLPFDVCGLGLFLELAVGLSAWKEYGDNRWCLRNHPSSGNLHPFESYLILPQALTGGDAAGSAPAAPEKSGAEILAPGLYHYTPRFHSLEQRCHWEEPLEGEAGGWGLIGITSLSWRTAWKYGLRAYRYVLLDGGHVLGALRMAAGVLGWSLRLLAPSDAQLATLLGLDRDGDAPGAEREEPDFLVQVGPALPSSPSTGSAEDANPVAACLDRAVQGGWSGQATPLSRAHRDWPGITAVAQACRKEKAEEPDNSAPAGEEDTGGQAPAEPAASVSGSLSSVSSVSSVICDKPAAQVIRQRRSAVAFDGETGLSQAGFYRLLARTLPDRHLAPWEAFPWAPAVHLALFVHRVEGLVPGLYLLVRSPASRPALQRDIRGLNGNFTWQAITEELPLYHLVSHDLREIAQTLSCRQGIAADGAFSLGMIASFRPVLAAEGPAAYRRLHWEAGLIGHVMYLEATAQGLSATGIGCFFDPLVLRVLGLSETQEDWRSLYHLAIGQAVEDRRLSTLPAYGEPKTIQSRGTAPHPTPGRTTP